MVPKLRETILYVIRRDFHLDPLHALLAPTFQQIPEMKSSITLPRNTLKQLLGLFIIAKYVTKSVTAFTICENIMERNMEHREFQELKSVGFEQLMKDVDDKSLKEELETCKHFLVDNEMEKG